MAKFKSGDIVTYKAGEKGYFYKMKVINYQTYNPGTSFKGRVIESDNPEYKFDSDYDCSDSLFSLDTSFNGIDNIISKLDQLEKQYEKVPAR